MKDSICSCSSHGGFLTAKGLAEAAQRDRQIDAFHEMGLTEVALSVNLDKVGSVSGSILMDFTLDDEALDQQARRHLHGS